MGSGGDRRPLERVGDHELRLAALLFRAIRDDRSRAAKEFEAQRIALGGKYQRLVGALLVYPVPGLGRGGPSTLFSVETYLQCVAIPRDTLYPSVPDPALEEAEAVAADIEQRQQTATAIFAQAWADITDCASQCDPTRIPGWNELSVELCRYVNAPWTRRFSHCRARRSKRRWVRQYVDDVRAFCSRWRLDAWWAVPAIIQSHFLDAQVKQMSGGTESFDEVLALFAGPVTILPEFTIAVTLPGLGFQRVESRHAERILSSTRWPVIADEAGPNLVHVLVKPTPQDRLALERSLGTSFAIIGWNGLPRVQSLKNSGQAVTIRQHVIEVVESRLGRPLTVREERIVRVEADAQIKAFRAEMARSGWRADGPTDHYVHARWTAARLLNPDKSFTTIALEFGPLGVMPRPDNDTVPSGQQIANAVRAFAAATGLHLDTARPRRATP